MPVLAAAPTALKQFTLMQQPPVAFEGWSNTQRQYLCGASDLGGTSRMWFTTSDAANEIRLVFTNYYATGAGEAGFTGPNSPITISSYLEDPFAASGTPKYPVTFSGASSVTIAWNGIVTSDPIELDLPALSTLWIRTFVQGVSGSRFPCNMLMCGSQQNFFGNAWDAGLGYNTTDNSVTGNNYFQDNAGAGTNQLTTAGTAWITGGTFAGNAYGPSQVIGNFVSPIQKAVVAVCGDSIAAGTGDDGYAGLGYIQRALRLNRTPSIYLPASSESMVVVGQSPSSEFNYHFRRALASSATHAIVEYGINDIFTNLVTLANLKTYAQTFYQTLVNRGLKVWAATITPSTTSSDGWITSGNQTVRTGEAVRTAWNDFLRSWTPGTSDPLLKLLSGVIDAASAIEVNASNVFTVNGGRYYCGPANNVTYNNNDGLHPSPIGHQLIATTVSAVLSQFVHP